MHSATLRIARLIHRYYCLRPDAIFWPSHETRFLFLQLRHFWKRQVFHNSLSGIPYFPDSPKACIRRCPNDLAASSRMTKPASNIRLHIPRKLKCRPAILSIGSPIWLLSANPSSMYVYFLAGSSACQSRFPGPRWNGSSIRQPGFLIQNPDLTARS